eukprot:gene10335-biopygen22806
MTFTPAGLQAASRGAQHGSWHPSGDPTNPTNARKMHPSRGCPWGVDRSALGSQRGLPWVYNGDNPSDARFAQQQVVYAGFCGATKEMWLVRAKCMKIHLYSHGLRIFYSGSCHLVSLCRNKYNFPRTATYKFMFCRAGRGRMPPPLPVDLLDARGPRRASGPAARGEPPPHPVQ